MSANVMCSDKWDLEVNDVHGVLHIYIESKVTNAPVVGTCDLCKVCCVQ